LGKVLQGYFPFLLGILREEFKSPVLALYSQEDDLEKGFLLLKALGFPVFKFPGFQGYLGEKSPLDPAIRGERISTLRAIKSEKNPVVLSKVKSILQLTPPPEYLEKFSLKLKKGSQYPWEELLGYLNQIGLQRVPRVEQLGEYSVRGGIIDVFTPSNDLPLRFEFLGDELNSIRIFDPETQVSREEIEETVLLPWRLFEVKEERLIDLEEAFKIQIEKLKRDRKFSEARFLSQTFMRDLEYLKKGISFLEEDYYLPFFARNSFLWEHLPSDFILICEEKSRISHAFEEFLNSSRRIYQEALDRGEQVPYHSGIFFKWEEFQEELESRRAVFCTPFSSRVELPLEAPPPLPQFADLSLQLRSWLNSGKTVLFAGKGARRYRGLLEGEGISFQEVSSFREEVSSESPIIWDFPLPSGFVNSASGLVVLSDFELFGWKKRTFAESKYKQAKAVSSAEQLQVGDYVVHQTYGIGIYQGLQTLNIDGVSRDYFKIAYAGEDKLYIPSDQVFLIQKYLGDSVKLPPLTRLNTTEWARTKKKVKESVEKVAQELLQIYAKKETSFPEPFFPLEPWETDLSQSFPYEETPDQAQTIADVLRDLERGKWMDRLVCGDVGYGKTEVAIRAAFRTVSGGKQVAVLVPTTILCQQHFNTFQERMKGFPVRIGVLSRFKSPREQNMVIKGLKEGKVDIVIGTHRLLSEDVRFKDLGLLIIDEEHRFGVLQKEKIRKIKGSVHVLSLSATPIPRTLQMSLLGIKDTSVMETAPQNRYPVKTFVTEFSDDLIKKAILYELNREGQVYFVHNRIQALPRLYGKLGELVPQARIGIAHGGMPEERLEQVMWDFAQGEYDVLLCTTIIESGIDIPRANTLIVADAHNLGLAQLYQLRGRVGRSDVRAYAYFLYPKSRALSEEAEKRLQTIRDFSQLGTGMKIALKDLEIRGAGNLLGKEQHGFMLQVGFQMYREMLEEAIERVKKGEELLLPSEERPVIEIGVNAFIPSDYMDPESKIEFYEKLASLKSKEKLNLLKAEMRDRFGPIPPPSELLFKVVEARVLCERIKISKVVREGNLLVFYWKEEPYFDPQRLVILSQTFPRRLKIKEDHFYLRLEGEHDGEMVDFVLKVLGILEKEGGQA
jgi:transcription-repair coupling factor (superfamily II helicase)